MSNILICFVVFFMATGSTLTLQPLLGLSLAQTTTCSGGNLPPGNGGDLEVTGACTATEGQTYHYDNVNIYKGGTLTFVDPAPDKKIHFWAKSILVEKDSSLIAGGQDAPIGTKCEAAREQGSSVYCGGMLTFHIGSGQEISQTQRPGSRPRHREGGGMRCPGANTTQKILPQELFSVCG